MLYKLNKTRYAKNNNWISIEFYIVPYIKFSVSILIIMAIIVLTYRWSVNDDSLKAFWKLLFQFLEAMTRQYLSKNGGQNFLLDKKEILKSKMTVRNFEHQRTKNKISVRNCISFTDMMKILEKVGLLFTPTLRYICSSYKYKHNI